jgi:pentose-5-phosphate-3-epimerase
MVHLTGQQLLQDVEMIGYKEMETIHVEVVPNAFYPNATIKTSDEFIDRDAKIIKVNVRIKSWNDYTQQLEVRQAMRIWLHLKERRLPYKIAGVYVSLEAKREYSSLKQAIVSNREFNKMYKEVADKKLNESDIITMLSDLWYQKR